MEAKFTGGKNIAMKVPPHQFDETVAFYRDILGFSVINDAADNVAFQFGHNVLWIDKVAGMSQAELWLEVITDDTKAAADMLKQAGVTRCDEVEKLGDGVDGFWVSSPAAIVHLMHGKEI